MTSGELMRMLTKIAEEQRENCIESIFVRNKHMNSLGDIDHMLLRQDILQEIVDAVLVDFINKVGGFQGLDWGLYTKDLNQQKEVDL